MNGIISFAGELSAAVATGKKRSQHVVSEA
jgi:hypothetical protein